MTTTQTFTRRTLLTEARSNLDQVECWVRLSNWKHAAIYAARAEAILDLMEAADCGSIGGFDEGQTAVMRSSLELRYQWLRKKK